MKIWLKYVIGIAIGVAAAYILPFDGVPAQEALDFVLEIVIRFGRYTLLPLLFFSITMACYRLREARLMLKTGVWTFGIIIVSSLLLTALGLATGLLVHLPRIPITSVRADSVPALHLAELLRKILPYNGFDAILEGTFLLPCFIFAGLAGAGMASERSATRDAVNAFDALSHVCYNVSQFFTDFLSVGMIAITCKFTLEFLALRRAATYTPLLLLLGGDLLLVAVVVYPLVLRVLCHEHRPYRVLYAGIAPVLLAIASGDTNLTLQVGIRHGHESLGIRRRVNAATFPLFAIFGRGGAALVQAVSFIVILRSYSSVELSSSPVATVLWVGGMAFLLSFALCDRPSGGPFFALALMCMAYGPSYEAGYLLLRDAAPILCAAAAGFDALTALFGSYIVANRTQMLKHVDARNFV